MSRAEHVWNHLAVSREFERRFWGIVLRERERERVREREGEREDTLVGYRVKLMVFESTAMRNKVTGIEHT
jgi:hypothetical protein